MLQQAADAKNGDNVVWQDEGVPVPRQYVCNNDTERRLSKAERDRVEGAVIVLDDDSLALARSPGGVTRLRVIGDRVTASRELANRVSHNQQWANPPRIVHR